MKKLLFLFSCSLLALSAGAQKIEPVKTTDDFAGWGIIPGKYTCDGKGRIYTSDYSYEEPYKFKIFDENLNEEKAFQFKENVVGYTLISRRDTVVTEKKRDGYNSEETRIYSVFSSINDVTLEHIKAFVEERFYNVRNSPSLYTYKEIARTSNTITYELGVDEDSVKKVLSYGYVGCNYIKGLIVCTFDNDSKTTLFKGTTSSYTYGPTFTGDWKQTKINGEFSYNGSSCLYLSDYDVVNRTDDNRFYLTQSLFNNDASYEYIVPINELYEYSVNKWDRDDDGEIDEIETVYGAKNIGFEIVQDNGTVLSSVKFGDGFILDRYAYNKELRYVHFANKRYLMVYVEKDKGDEGERETYTIFYSIDPSDPTSLKAVRTEKTGIKAMPAIARQSEVVNVDVSKFKNPRHVSVVSSNGQTVMTRHIADGQSHVEVQTSGLPAGLYIVKVTDGQSVSDNCKIIIR